MGRPIIVVHNGKSGSALPAAELRHMFKSAGFEVRKMITVSDSLGRDLAPYLKKSTWIAAVGGDGTVCAVANRVAGTQAVLVPIPGGTLNNYTKDLGINQDIGQAIADAAAGNIKQVDIASVNGDYFLNNSSIGLYPRSLVTRKQVKYRYGKWMIALYAMVKSFALFRVYRVIIDDKSVITPFVFVGNNDYHLESAGIANRTKLDGGKLSVYVVNSQRRWTLVRLSLRSLFGGLKPGKELIAYRMKSIIIESSLKRLHVSRDGELGTYQSPLEYVLHPKALRVVVSNKSKK